MRGVQEPVHLLFLLWSVCTSNKLGPLVWVLRALPPSINPRSYFLLFKETVFLPDLPPQQWWIQLVWENYFIQKVLLSRTALQLQCSDFFFSDWWCPETCCSKCQDPACVPPTAGGGVGILIKYCALGDRELQVLVMTSEGVDFKKEICFIKSQNVFSFWNVL